MSLETMNRDKIQSRFYCLSGGRCIVSLVIKRQYTVNYDELAVDIVEGPNILYLESLGKIDSPQPAS